MTQRAIKGSEGPPSLVGAEPLTSAGFYYLRRTIIETARGRRSERSHDRPKQHARIRDIVTERVVVAIRGLRKRSGEFQP